MRLRQNLDWLDRIGSDCSFRFADLILRGSAFGFRFPQNSNGFSIFFRFVFDLSGNLATPLISNSRKTQMVLRGMRDKANVAKITSRWLNIVGIRRKSRVSNNTRDFDLAMWST